MRPPQRPTDAHGAAVWDAGPDIYWRLDETAGTVAADAVSGDPSSTHSAGVTLGRPGSPAGRSVALPGGAQTVVAAAPVDPLETWFATTTTTGGRLIGFGAGPAGATSSNYDRHVYVLDSRQLRHGIWTGTASVIDSPAALQRRPVASSRRDPGPRRPADVRRRRARRYRHRHGPQPYTGCWRIGSDNTWGDASTNDFAGSVDETAVYPSALSAATVAQHWSLGGGGPR